MKYYLSLVLFFFVCSISAQKEFKFPSNEEEFEKSYERNVTKTRINGVYIPTSEEDAFEQITKLSDDDAWDKFKSGEEMMVVQKLKLGLGRWMEVNWNFFEGSRLSHYLKEKGLLHPEDMSGYLLHYFHRKLNKVEYNQQELIFSIAEARRELLKKDADYYNTETKEIPK